MSWDEIIAALSMLWARQKPELLQLLQPGLYNALRLALARPYALVTYHPETAGGASPPAQF